MRFHDLNMQKGVFVSSVEQGSPASNAGIRAGDIIVRYANEDIGGIDDLLRSLTHREFGMHAPVEILRGDQKVTVSVLSIESKRAA
jgi:S1-C subfamily serine protease